MVCRFIEKATALIIVACIITVALTVLPDWNAVGVYDGCPPLRRLTYHFFHASLLHAILNAWCFLSVMFIYDISWRRLILAFVIASTIPDFALSSAPTVGLSAVCFVLLGFLAVQAQRKLYYNGCMALYIAVGFLFPPVNGWLHLYSYVAGLLVGFLNMPIPCKRR